MSDEHPTEQVTEYVRLETPRGESYVLRHVPTNSFIPADGTNADYQAFLKWNAEQESPISTEGLI